MNNTNKENHRQIILLRGSSHAGKSTVAKLFGGNSVICCADDYFTDAEGNYNFDPEYLRTAHRLCRETFLKALNDSEVDTIVIANTSTKPSDYQFYIDEAKKRGIMVFSLVVERRHNNFNNHQIPEHVLVRQEENIKQSLKLR